jgi:hypothetical protein
MFVADVATDFEAQLLARDAERKAELLRQAQKYDDEGLKGVAQGLRQQTESLGTQRPLASVLPAIEHWQETQKSLFPDEDKVAVALLPAPAPAHSPVTASLPTVPQVAGKKKGR